MTLRSCLNQKWRQTNEFSLMGTKLLRVRLRFWPHNSNRDQTNPKELAWQDRVSFSDLPTCLKHAVNMFRHVYSMFRHVYSMSGEENSSSVLFPRCPLGGRTRRCFCWSETQLRHQKGGQCFKETFKALSATEKIMQVRDFTFKK